MHPPLSQTGLQKKIHQENINISPDNYFGSLIAPYIIRRYKKYIQLPLLDAGAGDGSFIKHLRKKFPDRNREIVGIDLVGNSELNILEGSVADLPFSEKSFETIICSEVLEHLSTKVLHQTLDELFRVLTPTGHLIATFPYDEDLQKQTFVCPHCAASFHRFGHVQSWHSHTSIYKMFSEKGFRVTNLVISPLGAVAKFPPIQLLTPLLNRLQNPPGLRKRAVVITRKTNLS